MQEQRTAKKKQYEAEGVICSICGYIVPDDDIELEGEAFLANYNKRRFLKWHLVICKQCSAEMEEIDNGGDSLARIKMGMVAATDVQ